MRYLPILILAVLLVTFPAKANYSPTVTGSLTDHSTAVLTTAALKLLDADASRKFVFVVNNSAVDISCSWTTTTPTHRGAGAILLVANGGSQTFETSYIVTRALYCIAASSSGIVVTVQTGP